MSRFYVIAPSFLAQVANGFLIFIFLFFLISNFPSFLKANYIIKLQIIGLLAIALGVHGTLHLGLEKVYGYNPLLIFA
jgi:hypothetical protein